MIANHKGHYLQFASGSVMTFTEDIAKAYQYHSYRRADAQAAKGYKLTLISVLKDGVA